ncbi:MAG: hypothetical protein KDD66_00880 [Bdellovibrionales bacterium]|nr:hypothetical protein [Bdellovibrionales bacterium]
MIPREFRPIVESVRCGNSSPIELFPGDKGGCRLVLSGRRSDVAGHLDAKSRSKSVVLMAAPYVLVIAADDGGAYRQRFHLFEVVMGRFELIWVAYRDFPNGEYEHRDTRNFVDLLHGAYDKLPLTERLEEECKLRREALMWLQSRNLPRPSALD